MKTIELDLEKDQKLDNLSFSIKNKRIRLGEEEFQLKIHIYRNIEQVLYAGFLLILAYYFIIERSKKSKKQDSGIYYDKQAKAYHAIYLKDHDVNKLESKIEKDFNVDIELEKKNPLDQVFGIWKNETLTIGKIREKAWQRTK